jgi:hypothetical protein
VKRSVKLNIAAAVCLFLGLYLVTAGDLLWLGLLGIAGGAVAGIAAGRAMATEPRDPSPDDEE